MTDIVHDTIVIEKTYEAPVSRVFAAFVDPVARAKWGAPSDTAIILYDTANFRIGGTDKFRCGSKSDPKYHGEARYLQIKPERLIVYAETINSDGVRLSASLNTVELRALGKSTKLTLTVQLAAFEGRDIIDGTRFGHDQALDNLRKFINAAT